MRDKFEHRQRFCAETQNTGPAARDPCIKPRHRAGSFKLS
jgi:hypothetical protein